MCNAKEDRWTLDNADQCFMGRFDYEETEKGNFKFLDLRTFTSSCKVELNSKMCMCSTKLL